MGQILEFDSRAIRQGRRGRMPVPAPARAKLGQQTDEGVVMILLVGQDLLKHV